MQAVDLRARFRTGGQRASPQVLVVVRVLCMVPGSGQVEEGSLGWWEG
jgi:hypothetical protein